MRRPLVPLLGSVDEEEAVYAALHRAAADFLEPAAVSPRRIAAVGVLTRRGGAWLEVGKPHRELDEKVMALFQAEDRGTVLVFTPLHGVWRGKPVAIPGEHVFQIRDFRR